jgi:hypothetical protein
LLHTVVTGEATLARQPTLKGPTSAAGLVQGDRRRLSSLRSIRVHQYTWAAVLRLFPSVSVIIVTPICRRSPMGAVRTHFGHKHLGVKGRLCPSSDGRARVVGGRTESPVRGVFLIGELAGGREG